jgi:hypothetical protein
MSMDHDDALRGALRQELDPLAPTAGFEPRVRSRLREHAARRRARAPRVVLSAVVTAALVAAMVGGFIATRGSGTRSITESTRILQDLTSGAAAAPVSDATSSYVWLTATAEGSACTATAPPGVSSKVGSSATVSPEATVSPDWWGSPTPNPCAGIPDCTAEWQLPSPSGDYVCQEPSTEVDVLDWTGTLRYHFQISPSESQVGGDGGIAAISPDGTRAVLDDGKVIDQSGATVGHLSAVSSLFSAGGPLFPGGPSGVSWLSDDSGVCIAGPSGVIADEGSVSGQATTTGTTLEVVPIDGQPRTVATLATGQTLSDPTSVDACDSATGTATLAVFVSASSSNPNDYTENVWSVQLSTGAVTYEQTPPVRSDEGQPWSIGSADGTLVAENIWNSQVDGCGAVEVINVALGQPVPIAASKRCPQLFALSADGTRFVGSGINAPGIDLVDASDGTVIRSVQVPGGTVVAAPEGAHFMVLLDGYLVLVDGSGGISQLHPAGVNLDKYNFAGFPFPSDQG